MNAARSGDTVRVAGHAFMRTSPLVWSNLASHVTILGSYAATNAADQPGPRDPGVWLTSVYRSSSSFPVRRKVDKDRTVTLMGKLYEAPVGLIGKTVTLLYHENEPGRIKVIVDENSAGFLQPLDTGINSRVRRRPHQLPELVDPAPDTTNDSTPRPVKAGLLFGNGERS